MVDDSPQLTAELAYQRALTALHEARAELAEVSSARRRLAYERVQLDPAEALGRDQQLAARFAEVTERAERLRLAAAALREEVRRFSEDEASEPDDVPDDASFEGFEQPPYPEQGL